MDAAEIARVLGPLAERTAGLRLLLLVGSRARGDAHAGSDIDLAYLADDDLDLGTFIGEVTMALGTDDVDVSDLARANALYRFHAADDGIRIHGEPEVHDDFRFRAVSFWCDAGPIIRAGYAETLANLG